MVTGIRLTTGSTQVLADAELCLFNCQNYKLLTGTRCGRRYTVTQIKDNKLTSTGSPETTCYKVHAHDHTTWISELCTLQRM